MSGVDLESGRAYAQWLREYTGRNWRLPTVEEWQAAAKTVKPEHENNLCHWAGYSPTFDEAQTLRERIEAGPGPRALLRPVASVHAGAETAIFDLQGSVAEWCWKEGEGSLQGRTVLDTCDDTATVQAPSFRDLWGLRVVLEP